MSISRRDFLRTSAATAAGLTATPLLANSRNAKNCIFLMLTGGPSQLDTWDPKPNAPSDVRGPFKPISTRIPGVQFTELFPKTAALADRITVVRSMHHTSAPIHETGFQLLQTGQLADVGKEGSHFGAMASATHGSRSDVPANILLPGPIGFTGVNIGHGQSAGDLGETHAPVPFACDIA